MGIKVEHAASPGVTIMAGAAAGQAASDKKIAVGAAQAASAKVRQEEAIAGRERMQESQQAFQAEMLGAKAVLERGEFEYRLTAQQKADQEKYDTALYEIQQSEAFTEDEKEEAERRIMAKKAAIKPLGKRRDKQPTPAELFQKHTYRDAETGAIYPIDPQTGAPGKPIYDPSQMVKQRNDAYKTATELFRDPETGKVDRAAVEAHVQKVMGGAGQGGRGQDPLPDPSRVMAADPARRGDPMVAAFAGAMEAPAGEAGARALPAPAGAAPQAPPSAKAPGLEVSDIVLTTQQASIKSIEDMMKPEYVQSLLTGEYRARAAGVSKLTPTEADKMAGQLEGAIAEYKHSDARGGSRADRVLALRDVIFHLKAWKNLIEGQGQ